MDKMLFVDNHTHGAFGVDFNTANYDDIKFLLKKYYERNIRGICPTLVGDSDENIQKQLYLIQQIKEKQMDFCHNEALILGVHLEGTFLSPSRSGIQDKSVFMRPTINNFKNLVGDFEDIVKIVTVAPEENIDLIDYLNSKGIKTQAGHSGAESLQGCIATTHHFNAMSPIHHRNKTICLEGLIRDDIYCEFIADLVHCNIDILTLIKKVKPENKILLVSDSLPCAHSEEDIIFCNKKISKEGKDENGVLAGSCKTLDEICHNLIEKEILTKEQVYKMAFLNQIEYLGLNTSEVDILKR